MYATPDPRAYSSLRVTIKSPVSTPEFNVHHLFNRLTSITTDPTEESLCINLYQENSAKSLVKLPTTGLCKDKETEDALSYFLHFGAKSRGAQFVSQALEFVGQSNADAYVFLTKQRIDIFRKEAFLESFVFSMGHHQLAFLGTIKSKGDTYEGANF